MFAGQPLSLLGDSFARYFLRAVRHDPPATLAELQAELRAECPDSAPDYRASPEILSRSLRESGLEGQTFVRHVGGAEVCRRWRAAAARSFPSAVSELSRRCRWWRAGRCAQCATRARRSGSSGGN